MSQNERRGPGPGLLLLIPIGLIIAKGMARRRRQVLESGAGPHPHPRFGHGFGGPGFGARSYDAEGGVTFTLPPRLERMLGAWHERVHEATEPVRPAPTGETATA